MKLIDFGINIGLIVAGFFGSLITIGKTSASNISTTLTSIVTGVASSNYLTPTVCDMLSIKEQKYMFSVAFILGFLGLKGVELVSEKLLKKDKNDTDKSTS